MARTRIGLLLGLLLVKIRNGANCSELSFKQPNCHLEFNSVNVPRNGNGGLRMYELNSTELLPILKIVSKKFSKIYTDIWKVTLRETLSTSYDPTAIPKAVALHNKQNKNKIELLMTIYENTIKPLEFDRALQAANNANSIFPGSVTHFLAKFDKYKLNFVNEETILAEQDFLGYPFKIGVIIPVYECIKENFFSQLDNQMGKGIRNVSLLILDGRWDAPTGNKDRLVENYILKIHSKYNLCVKKIESIFVQRPAEFGIQIMWVKHSGNINTTLFHAWSVFNKWSIENNLKIFIKSAFENVELSMPWSSSNARWKIITTEGANIQLIDNFGGVDEDKVEDNFREVGEKEDDSGNMTSTTEKGNEYEDPDIVIPAIVLILGIACGVLVGMILLVLYIQHKRVQRKICLTRKDIREFYKGSEGLKTDGENNCEASIEGSAYKKEFEVDKENFKFSDVSLGSGAFGEVWKGTVIKDGMEVEVAAKTLKKCCPTTTLKGFLSEIKIMGYLGKHENLVGIVGAYTKGLERGKVIVFTELCEKGSLESYLRNLSKNLVGEDVGVAAEVDLICLKRWCLEISNGMEYLSSKNVVHADLATRNVLLNDELIAKISDFGLSRRLYDYSNYVKKQQEPLPWKNGCLPSPSKG